VFCELLNWALWTVEHVVLTCIVASSDGDAVGDIRDNDRAGTGVLRQLVLLGLRYVVRRSDSKLTCPPYVLRSRHIRDYVDRHSRLGCLPNRRVRQLRPLFPQLDFRWQRPRWFSCLYNDCVIVPMINFIITVLVNTVPVRLKAEALV